MATETPVQPRDEELGRLLRSVRAVVNGVRAIWRIIRRDPLALIGLAILTVFVLAALIAEVAPFVIPYTAQGQGAVNLNPADRLLPPSPTHWFGTDGSGRDLFSRIWFGAGLALWVGLVTVVLAFPVGVLLGVVAGYVRGPVEQVIMRVTDMFLAFPTVLLAIVIAATLNRGTTAEIIAMAVSFWPWYTRLVHSQVQSVRSQPFVESAVVLGLPRRLILMRHILPNSLTSATIQATLDVGSAILIAAALSWIGLGPQPGAPDWGVMLQSAYVEGNFLTFWWLSTFVGLALFLVVLAFNLLGDSLRDALDPKLRRRRAI